MKVLALFPDFVEQYYSNGLYLYISKISRVVLGWIPFSVGDLCYTILIFFMFKWIYKNRKGFFINWKANGLTVLSFISVFISYFIFYGELIITEFRYIKKLELKRNIPKNN